MKKIKKLSALFLAVSMMVLLSGCTLRENAQDNLKDDGRLKVVTTIFPAYDFARQIGGDKVDVQMLLRPGEELHSYEPSPKDIIAIEQCSVFIYVGGESDTWVEDILDSIDTSHTAVIAMMKTVEALEEETIEGMDTGNPWSGHHHDHDEQENGSAEREEAPEYDEHVWTSPLNAEKIAEKIADEFCIADPGNEQEYRKNEKLYVGELGRLADELIEIRKEASRSVIVVGDRFPFRYLADFMDLRYYAAFPGCAEETEPSAQTVAFLIDEVKRDQIPVVFYGEFSNHLIADRICEETDAAAMMLHSCHNLTKDEFESGVTYLDLMRQNAKNLRTALGADQAGRNGE